MIAPLLLAQSANALDKLMKLPADQIGAALAACLGLALAAFILAFRGTINDHIERDIAWVKTVAYRFTPEPVEPRPYVIAYYGMVFVVTVFLFVVTPLPVLGLIVGGILLMAPRPVANYLWESRKQKIDEQLPIAVLQMASSVGSGMSLAQAIDRLAQRAEKPIRVEFQIMSNQWKAGSDLVSTLEETKRRLRLPNFNLFASALLVNQTMGGNVVQTLQTLATSLEAIDRMRRDIRVATSEGRTNIKVLAGAPLIMLLIVSFIEPHGTKLLFTTASGWIMLGIALALTGLGTAWAWKIVNTDV
jgi:tight adherence protein B